MHEECQEVQDDEVESEILFSMPEVAAFGKDRCTVMEIPIRIVDRVRAMIARETKVKRAKAA